MARADENLLPEEDPRMAARRRDIDLYKETGYWWDGDPRTCGRCGAQLPPAEPPDFGGACCSCTPDWATQYIDQRITMCIHATQAPATTSIPPQRTTANTASGPGIGRAGLPNPR